MDFLTLAQNRYSVRKFDERPVEQEKIDRILKAGHAAPTACNLQPQKIFVLKSEAVLDKLKRITKCHFNAPLAMLVCYDKTVSWKRKYDGKDSGDIDASIVTTHMMMEAWELGIGSTWVMHFDPAAARAELDLSDDLEPTAFLMLGYPAEDAVPFHLHNECKDEDQIVEIL